MKVVIWKNYSPLTAWGPGRYIARLYHALKLVTILTGNSLQVRKAANQLVRKVYKIKLMTFVYECHGIYFGCLGLLNFLLFCVLSFPWLFSK